MSKSILVIDTPENCIGCDFSDCELKEWYCERAERYLRGSEGEESRPDWCPLRDLPGKMSMENQSFFDSSYVAGRNALIDEILKYSQNNQ